jgi:hypothetical protein
MRILPMGAVGDDGAEQYIDGKVVPYLAGSGA